jgi:hypothetical protein
MANTERRIETSGINPSSHQTTHCSTVLPLDNALGHSITIQSTPLVTMTNTERRIETSGTTPSSRVHMICAVCSTHCGTASITACVGNGPVGMVGWVWSGRYGMMGMVGACTYTAI